MIPEVLILQLIVPLFQGSFVWESGRVHENADLWPRFDSVYNGWSLIPRQFF